MPREPKYYKKPKNNYPREPKDNHVFNFFCRTKKGVAKKRIPACDVISFALINENIHNKQTNTFSSYRRMLYIQVKKTLYVTASESYTELFEHFAKRLVEYKKECIINTNINNNSFKCHNFYYKIKYTRYKSFPKMFD